MKTGLEDLLMQEVPADALAAVGSWLEENRGHAAAHGERLRRRAFRSGATEGTSKLLRCCQGESILRLDTLCFVESKMDEAVSRAFDYGLMIMAAAQIVEVELGSCLQSPLAAGRELWSRALEDEPRILDAVRRWVEGNRMATMGALTLALVALRKALGRNSTGMTGVLARFFAERYPALVQTGGPEAAMTWLTETRNEVAHGRLAANADHYRGFCRAVWGTESASRWAVLGPAPEVPASGEAVMHHHLAMRIADAGKGSPEGGAHGV